MITTAATVRNIRLIVELIITSYTGIAYHIQYHAATPRFQSIHQCWVCVCRAISLSVLYTV